MNTFKTTFLTALLTVLLVTAGGAMGGEGRMMLAFVFAPLMTLLLTAFFAHRLVQSGDFIPFGPMGALDLVALVFYCALPAKESL